MPTLDDIFNEHESVLERRARERRERAEAEAQTPEGRAAQQRYLDELHARREAEHAKGVRLGWWDEDGNPLNTAEDDEPEDDGEEEEEDA